MGRFKITEMKKNINYMEGISYDIHVYEPAPGAWDGQDKLIKAIESIDGDDFTIPIYVPNSAFDTRMLMVGRRNGKTQFTRMLLNGILAAPDHGIKKVIFNDPATIVLWADGIKTVVKCQPGDTYDKEVGLALCIAKRAMGNQSNFNNVFKKWCGDENDT